MMRLFSALAICLSATTAAGYTLVTSVSDSCHEKLTFEAINFYLTELGDRAQAPPSFKIPTDRVTQGLMNAVRPRVPAARNEQEVFFAVSILVGVRAPDTEGHSTLNLTALRRLHADPAPIGQYAHALRGPADDGLQGDLTAVEGTKEVIRSELAIARQELINSRVNPSTRIEKRGFFIDHYDTVQVPVSLTAYHMGRAIHALQDAHAHMVRSGERFEHVVHVTNYVDAVNGNLKIERDGLAHSNVLDDCTRAEVEPIVDQARARSVALVDAFVRRDFGEEDAIERGLSPCADNATEPARCGWVEYEPTCKAAIEAGDDAAQAEACCTAANDFCSDTVPAAALAKLEPAGPYLGCSTQPAGPTDAGWWWLLPTLLGVRRRWLLALLGLPGQANAVEPSPVIDYVKPAPDWFVSLEGHGAAFNDTPNASLLDIEFGYTLRFGRQIDRWRIIGIVDRSHWVPLEFGARVDPGTLNMGVGGELLLFDGFVRIGMGGGVSILLFDTFFDQAGEVGYFIETRPAGLRWKPLETLVIVFDPISMSFLHPVVRNPPLRKLHRRASVGVEYLF